jgi:hypothetical protein
VNEYGCPFFLSWGVDGELSELSEHCDVFSSLLAHKEGILGVVSPLWDGERRKGNERLVAQTGNHFIGCGIDCETARDVFVREAGRPLVALVS